MVNIVDNQNVMIEVNDKFLEATGYARQELIGQPISKLHQDVRLAGRIAESLRQGLTWQGETPLRRADGNVCRTQATILPLMDEDNNWVGSISVRNDVTHVHRLLEKRAVAETLHELRNDVWIVDAETHQFTYMNKAAQQRTGLSSSEYVNQTFDSMSDCDGCAAVAKACRSLSSNDGQVTNIEIQIADCPLHVSIKYLKDRDDNGRYLILLTDISDRVTQEAQKAAFVSTVSHELRSPLAAIKGSMGLLLANAAGDMSDRARSLLEISHRNANRLILIINDILDLEKISSGTFDFDVKNADLSEIVREANEATATLDQRFSIDVKVIGAENACPVQTDPNRIMQVLTNFLSNACKFSPPGGSVTIKLSEAADHVRVAVTDEGPGIPTADQHKVFERFADLSNSDRASKGGTGLGLSICKAIVEGMGGNVGFETREGRGSTFYFTLPRSTVTSLDQNATLPIKVAG